MSDVIVKVRIPSGLHGKFRLWTFENRTTMQRALMGAVEGICSGVTTSGRVVKRKEVGDMDEPLPKPVVKQSKAIGGVVVGPIVESEFKCKVCGKPTKGEFLCVKCKK